MLCPKCQIPMFDAGPIWRCAGCGLIIRPEERCPHCLTGRLVKPAEALNAPEQPDLVCDLCGAPYWRPE